MSRLDKTNLLEICIEQLEAGRTAEEIFAAYPEHAALLGELLPVARSMIPTSGAMRVPATAQVDSRKRLLAYAQELRARPEPSILQRMLWALASLGTAFNQHAGSVVFSAVAILLLFVALGSLKSLPGDQLYPVKIAAEQAGISLASDPTTREERVSVFDTQRAAEVTQMIQMKRSGAVSFGGFLDQNTSKTGWQVAGIPLDLTQNATAQVQQFSGFYVEVKGSLDTLGVVQVDRLEPRLETLIGTITQMDANTWKVGSQTVQWDENTRITGMVRLGGLATIQAMHRENNGLLAVSASVTGGTPPAPTSTITPTVTPTATLEPTATSAPVIAPIVPTVDDHSSDHSQDSEHPKPTSESSHEDSSSHSGD